MQLVATQNFKNLLNSWSSSNAVSTPTAFSNAPDVDNGKNLITMGTGTSVFGKTCYTMNDDTTQRIVQVGARGHLNSDNTRYIPVWDRSLAQTRFDASYNTSTYTNALIMLFGAVYSNNPLDVYSGNVQNSLGILLSDDDTPVTLNTTNCGGKIYGSSSANEQITGRYANKMYIPFKYSTDELAPSFTAKKLLITTTFPHNMTTFPPIILAGGLLDTPIEVNPSASLSFELTHNLNMNFS